MVCGKKYILTYFLGNLREKVVTGYHSKRAIEKVIDIAKKEKSKVII